MPDGLSDDAYLHSLQLGLDKAFTDARPEVVLYLAGTDPYKDDILNVVSAADIAANW